MTAALGLALLLGAADAAGGRLPPAPREVFTLSWKKRLVGPRSMEWKPREPGGAAFDPVNKVLVVGTRDGWLHGLRPDGSRAWEFKGDGAFSAEPAIDGDTVYAGCDDGRLYAVAVTSGALRWSWDSREPLGTRPVVAGGFVYVASLSDAVYAVNAATGAWAWHHRREPREGFSVHGAANVAVGGGVVFAGYSDGVVVALDGRTGQVRWERQVAPSGTYLDVDGLWLEEGRLYATAYSGAVVALDAASGRPAWQREVKDAARVVAVRGLGLVVVVSMDRLMALSPIDGRVTWDVPLRGSPGGEVRAAGPWLLVPSGEGGLQVVEAVSGRVLRTLDPGTGVTASVALAGDRAWVLSNGGTLLALEFR